jgi:PAP2 superfamily
MEMTWAERGVRRFWWMMLGVGALFAATELVALTGWVPHLGPVSLEEVTTNVLFAIGFGCPLLLYVSSLPGWTSLLKTLAAGTALGALLWLLRGDVPSARWATPQDVATAKVITGLGLASIGALALRAWRGLGPQRTWALLYLLPAVASLLFTLQAGIFYDFISSVFPLTCDSLAYAADAGYGFQPSFAVGRLFAAAPPLAWVCKALYEAPPPGLVFVFALQTRARRPPPVDVVTALLALGLTGYSLYFLFPVCGPLPAFGAAFPAAPPAVDFDGRRMFVDKFPRNGMPSLHLASVLVAYWHAKPYGPWARAAAGLFVAGTFLATMGLGEHYLVDLVVAAPFTLAVHAACTPRWPGIRREQATAFLGATGLVLAWYGLLTFGIPLLLWSPVITWAVTLTTVAAVVLLERRLARAAEKRLPEWPTPADR